MSDTATAYDYKGWKLYKVFLETYGTTEGLRISPESLNKRIESAKEAGSVSDEFAGFSKKYIKELKSDFVLAVLEAQEAYDVLENFESFPLDREAVEEHIKNAEVFASEL